MDWVLRNLPEDIKMENEFGLYSLTFKEIPGGIYVEKYIEFKQLQISAEAF